MNILDKVHKINLDLLIMFDEICKKHEITYYMGYGTLLGSVRHKDFIPWDNDVDILLPRPDFERLLPILEQELDPETYELVRPSFYGKKYRDIVPYINYKKARIKVDPEFDAFYEGKASYITLDLFVLDKMPADFRGKLLTARLEALCGMNNAHRYRFNYDGYKGLLKVAAFVLCQLGKCFSAETIRRRVDKLAQKYRNDDSVTTCSVTNDNFSSYAYRIPVKDLGKGKPMPIGDHFFNGPLEYHNVLSQYYGDYMTPPPPEKQVPHLAVLETMGDDSLTEDKFEFTD